MPIQMPPDAGEPLATKPVRPPQFDAEGPYEEHFDILAYRDESVFADARQAHTKTTTQGNGRITTQEFSQAGFVRAVVQRQLKGWRIIAPADEPEANTEADPAVPGVRWWKYNEYNIGRILRLPDVTDFLFAEIEACGGIVTTRDVLITMESGQKLDFFRTFTQLRSSAEPAVPGKAPK